MWTSTWGGDNFIVSNPPPAWGHTPLYGGPSPRIPPYILSECPFGGIIPWIAEINFWEKNDLSWVFIEYERID